MSAERWIKVRELTKAHLNLLFIIFQPSHLIIINYIQIVTIFSNKMLNQYFLIKNPIYFKTVAPIFVLIQYLLGDYLTCGQD
jgi:hypothetical protein